MYGLLPPSPLPQAGSSGGDDMDYFVQAQGGRFVVNCKPFYASGFNQWAAVEAAAGGLELL